ncbi:pimeloyl-ACP methyl ester carboxylesterase [Arthrobacter pigmenti]|uniref:Pimeloyl-ACP methyl ester carboxylesterase n=1 Tax=Arthrobacter pigmenti TaxID=271432 RepID=A0A846RNK0_9MICC|nr:alpha/beta hydrolase [Arthrobacter pigmenti]NJC22659.1 pimeloyl-ACP methyl ester carboxylesterase [Arthrobacter pigmenti]
MFPLLLLGVGPVVAAGAGGDGSAATVQHAVSFTVQNVNNSKIACEADGQTYTVRGHITGPQEALENPSSVTLFLHGLSYGEFFTNYNAQPDYNFAQKQAAAGNVTVTIDRLGYDSSDKPAGMGICFGSRADIAHQIVDQLRGGQYGMGDGTRSIPAFDQVVIAGHSVGGIIAQATAYSFGNVDGLMVLSYSDTTVSPAAMQAMQTATAECQAGGGPSEGGAPGYVYFGAATPEQFIMAHFFTDNADPAVIETTASMRNLDPCGDIMSYMGAVDANKANVASITVPTLVLIGGDDAIYPIQAEDQAALLTGVQDLTSVTIPATGHAVTLHNTKDEFSNEVSTWLNDRNFGSSQMGQMPVGGADTGVSGAAGTEGTDRSSAVLFGVAGLALLTAAAVHILRRRTTN